MDPTDKVFIITTLQNANSTNQNKTNTSNTKKFLHLNNSKNATEGFGERHPKAQPALLNITNVEDVHTPPESKIEDKDIPSATTQDDLTTKDENINIGEPVTQELDETTVEPKVIPDEPNLNIATTESFNEENDLEPAAKNLDIEISTVQNSEQVTSISPTLLPEIISTEGDEKEDKSTESPAKELDVDDRFLEEVTENVSAHDDNLSEVTEVDQKPTTTIAPEGKELNISSIEEKTIHFPIKKPEASDKPSNVFLCKR